MHHLTIIHSFNTPPSHRHFKCRSISADPYQYFLIDGSPVSPLSSVAVIYDRY